MEETFSHRVLNFVYYHTELFITLWVSDLLKDREVSGHFIGITLNDSPELFFSLSFLFLLPLTSQYLEVVQ